MDALYLLVPCFFATALIYAAAGFGGGSIYLALLVLCGVSFAVIPKVALCCNLLVVSGGLYHYIRNRHVSWQLVLPFVVTSIPCAYVGGGIAISKEFFLAVLGISLGVAGVRMLAAKRLVSGNRVVNPKTIWVVGLPLGAALGVLSGLVGIGGGIFLSPLMHLLGWGRPRQIAASSSVFIFVNSLAGLWGQWSKDSSFVEPGVLVPLLVAVVAGGQIGSRLSVGRLGDFGLQRLTAVLVLVAAVRLYWRLA